MREGEISLSHYESEVMPSRLVLRECIMLVAQTTVTRRRCRGFWARPACPPSWYLVQAMRACWSSCSWLRRCRRDSALSLDSRPTPLTSCGLLVCLSHSASSVTHIASRYMYNWTNACHAMVYWSHYWSAYAQLESFGSMTHALRAVSSCTWNCKGTTSVFFSPPCWMKLLAEELVLLSVRLLFVSCCSWALWITCSLRILKPRLSFEILLFLWDFVIKAIIQFPHFSG
jgi:hypothetical protein